jgi:membrane-bound serine protease (ClpP class)
VVALQNVLADPTLVYALFVVGCLAALTEVFHPGSLVPGISGAVCLLLAAVGLLALPVNVLSLVLMLAGMVLFTLDVQVTAHGGLTAAGLAAFVAGSLTLFGLPVGKASLAVSLPLIAVIALMGALLSTLMVRAAVRVRHVPSLHGPERFLGQTGTVMTALAPTGTVRVAGELWSARVCAAPAAGVAAIDRAGRTTEFVRPTEITIGDVGTLLPGQPVRIVGRRGLVLDVEPVQVAGGRARRSA